VNGILRIASCECAGKSVTGSFCEIGVSESNVDNRCRAGDLGGYRLSLRRIHCDSPKESPRYRPNPSHKERARDRPDPAYCVMDCHWWRRNPDLCWPAQDHVKFVVRSSLSICGQAFARRYVFSAPNPKTSGAKCQTANGGQPPCLDYARK
jgi:hypothetical protein